MTKREKFLQGYRGTSLLSAHALSERGVWQVTGEDENADWGGHHFEPTLGFFRGRLDDVIDVAVNDRFFWTWGAGGNIKKIEVTDIG